MQAAQKARGLVNRQPHQEKGDAQSNRVGDEQRGGLDAGAESQNRAEDGADAGRPAGGERDADEGGGEIPPAGAGVDVHPSLGIEERQLDHFHQGEAKEYHHRPTDPADPVGAEEAAQRARRYPQGDKDGGKADDKLTNTFLSLDISKKGSAEFQWKVLPNE